LDAVRKISAKVYLLSTDEGGRKLPIGTGYRPAIYFGKKQTDGILSFHRDEKPTLGSEYTVTIGLIHPEYLGKALKKGAVFDLKEGSKIIARGTVLDVKT
jgi:elongation factor Tu